MNSKNPLRRIFESRLFWAIVSLLASLATWVYVTSADASDFRQTFRNVRVELVGEDTLRSSRNLVVTDLDVGSVTVVISGPRRIVNPMDSDDLVAQVDVSKLTTAAYTSLKYDIVYPSGVSERELTVERKSPEYVNFNVSLLTFTDGLDNASLMLNGNYENQEAYLNAVSNRIHNDRVKGKPINAYSIGLKGQDVSDEQAFRQRLEKLASNDGNV